VSSYGNLLVRHLLQGSNAVPCHVLEKSLRIATGAESLSFVAAQPASLRSHVDQVLPNEGKRSWRVVF